MILIIYDTYSKIDSISPDNENDKKYYLINYLY